MALLRFVKLIAVSSLAVSAAAGEHAITLQGKGMRLAFDTEGKGFNCIGIENRVNPESAAFCGEKPGCAAFWSLTFWKDGSPANALTIDNLAPCERKVVRRGDALVFDWRGLSLGDEQTFSYGEGANRKTVTLSPRSVSSDICRMHNPRP